LLHDLAAHTLLAHLLKLERDGRAAVRDGREWVSVSGPA
jgi:hypothetical protein